VRMEVYVINLDSCLERWDRIRALLAPTDLRLHRVPAVDGRRLHERTRPAPLRVGAIPAERGLLSRFEIACVLSHRRVWRRFLRSQASHCLVLEDDVYLGDRFAEFLTDAALLSAPYDLLKLETYRERTLLGAGPAMEIAARWILPLQAMHRGSAGYVVTRNAAERLLRLSAGAPLKLDHVLFNADRIRRCGLRPLRIGQVVPGLVIQHDRHPDAAPDDAFLASIIAAQRGVRAAREPLTPAKIARELARPFRDLWFRSRAVSVEFR